MSLNISDFRTSINGDSVIGFTTAEEMKVRGWLDATQMSTYMMEEDGKNHSKHLGLINLFATTERKGMPFMRDLFEKSAVLEVQPGQSVTYDLPVTRSHKGCYTVEDTSTVSQFPGLDETTFPLILSQEFTKGDILTYDMQYGEQVIVSNNHEVEQVGENFKHYVYYWTNDKTKNFPNDKLKSGIEYFKVTNVLGEYDTDFSSMTMVKNPMGTITNEFILGDPRGIETFSTAKAGDMYHQGLTQFATDMMERAQERLDAIGAQDKEMFLVMDRNPKTGGVDKNSVRIGTTLEYLALAELSTMECYSLLFSKAGSVRSGNGSKMVNEGVWHQWRRGKIIKYSRPGGITFSHIQEAASYIFKNTGIPVKERVITFKVGSMAEANIRLLFREEIRQQLAGLPAPLMGTTGQIQSVFSGPNDALELDYIAFAGVFVPGIGRVRIELDESMDFIPNADRFSQGYYGNGFAHTSYSMIITDATSPKYSNVKSKVKGGKLVEGGSETSNVYYIKPEGRHLVWGREQGRMADGNNTSNIVSSLKYMGRTFWATSHSSSLVLDTTRQVLIELQK